MRENIAYKGFFFLFWYPFWLKFETSSWSEKHFCCFLWKIPLPLFVYFNSVCNKYARSMGIMFKENTCKTERAWNKITDNFKHNISWEGFLLLYLKKKKKMTSNFLQGWHKHYTPKLASVLLIRSQIIPLTHLSLPRFCYSSVILPSTSLVCCSVWKLFTLTLFSYLPLKLSFFVS